MYIIGVIVFIVGILAGMRAKGFPYEYLLHLQTIYMLVPAWFAVIVGTSGRKPFMAGFKAAIFKEYNITEQLREEAEHLFKFLVKTTIIVTIIAMLIAMFVTLEVIDDVGLRSRSLSSALISPIIGMSISIGIFEPIIFILKKKGREKQHLPQSEERQETYD